VAHRTGRRQCLGERLSVVGGFGHGGERQGIRFGIGERRVRFVHICNLGFFESHVTLLSGTFF
jgi:hypothetical protein